MSGELAGPSNLRESPPFMLAGRRTTLLVFAAGMIAWITTAVILWLEASPLGHDEAQYALAAMHRLNGLPPRWNYLSVGMDAIAAPGVLAGGSEHALRFVPAVIGIVFVLAAAQLARGVAGAVTAAWTVTAMAATVALSKRSVDLLSDVPSAMCLLVGISILITELTRDPGPRWRLAFVAPVFAAAFYLRYGSCMPIAIIGVVSLVFGWRAIVSRPAPVIATVVLLALLLVPHAVAAIEDTGSPIGFLLSNSDVLGIEYYGVGLVTYLTTNPLRYYGIVTTPLLIIGLLSIVRVRDRRRVMLWVIAVASFVFVGTTAIAQPRYVFLSMTLLLVLGIDVIVRWIATRPPRARTALGATAAAAIATSWVLVVIGMVRLGPVKRTGAASTIVAASVIRRDAAGARCQVVARRTNQIEWYSGCSAAHFTTAADIEREVVYFVRNAAGDREPSIDPLPGHRKTLLDVPGLVLVLRLDP